MAQAVRSDRVVIVGAGIAGLAAALRLAQAGCAVTVVEAQAAPGGKMRALPSVAGPVDAGPTVLTLRQHVDALFEAAGESLESHLTLHPLTTLARHYWRDGTAFDLMADPEATAANLAAAFGAGAVDDWRAFSARAGRLFDAFDAPMMQAARPTSRALAARVLRDPGLIRAMAPHQSLAAMLSGAFRDPRLAQLYGRYATYVGGAPQRSPALLALIAAAEARGVWVVEGGMHRLAATLGSLARARGATFRYGEPVRRIEVQGGRAAGVVTDRGRIPADAVLFNGDPRALACGLLGDGPRAAVPARPLAARSLSAMVLAFAAAPAGPPLAHHTVFFGDVPDAEFPPILRGEQPADATLYLCAQDRHDDTAPGGPGAPERFEIILNAPPLGDPLRDTPETEKEARACLERIVDRLGAFGLSFAPPPTRADLTTPAGFDGLFPGSRGSLYGQSPHGLTAGLKRPGSETAVPGLFLCGGGAHPGAGVPMAILSARHAAEAILTGLALPSRRRRAAMPGGMSTASQTTAGARFRSSDS